jgi:hypothetical protein
MTTSKRLILWAGDGPLNARDEIVGYIMTRIDEALQETEEDTSSLNDLMAYFRCLNGVLREAGGQHLISDRVAGWRHRTLAAYDSIRSLTSDEVRDERPFIVSVLDDLDALTRP